MYKSQKILNIRNMPDVMDIGTLQATLRKRVTNRMLRHFMERELEEGRIVRLSNGIYAKVGADPYRAAGSIYKGYIGFSSALYLLGLKEEAEKEITICTSSNRKKVRFLNKVFVPINLSELAFGMQIKDNLVISTYPKTIFDMLYRPKYANMFDMFRAINRRELTEDEWRELLYYLKKSNISTMRRAGYALEHVAPQWFTKELNKLSDASRGVSFFQKVRNEGYNKKWRIYGGFNIMRWKNAY